MGNFNTSLPSPNTDNVYRFADNTEYFYDLILYNANEEFVRLKTQSVVELIINDNLLDFYHKGTLTFKNDMDAIEKITTSPDKIINDDIRPQNTNKPNTLLPFAFRGDARDYLIVDICPKIDDQANYNYGDNVNKLWRLKFVFSIYDIEDIVGQSNNEKFKKLHFWDYSYQLMTEKSIDLNSANYVNNQNILNLDNEDRSIKTGLLIKNLIKETFPLNEGFKINFGQFDEGATKLFYTSPVNSTASDDLEYIDSYHVSSPSNNYDFCILRKERFTNDYTYKSLKNYFDEAYVRKTGTGTDSGGSLHIEKFLVGSYSDSETSNYANKSRTPISSKNSAFLPDYSQIQKYRFFPSSGQDVQKHIATRHVYAYNFNNKQFEVDVQENSFERILDVFYINYVKSFKGESGSPYTTLTKNEYRINNKNYETEYSVSTDKEQRLAFGRNEVLKKALYLNNTINFTAPGLTLRQAGRFVSIDRDSSQPSNKFDDKFLGTYFIVEINHIFRSGSYENEITAIKPYVFTDPKNTELVI